MMFRLRAIVYLILFQDSMMRRVIFGLMLDFMFPSRFDGDTDDSWRFWHASLLG